MGYKVKHSLIAYHRIVGYNLESSIVRNTSMSNTFLSRVALKDWFLVVLPAFFGVRVKVPLTVRQ